MSGRKRPAKRRAEKSVTDEIRRAARRAGIKLRPQPKGLTFDDYMALNQGEQYEKLLRQAGHTDDKYIAEQLRIAAQQMADRAIALRWFGATTMVNLQSVRSELIRSTEFLSEVVAVLPDPNGFNDGTIEDKVMAALRAVWRARWEIGSGPEEVAEVGDELVKAGAA